MSVWYYVPNLLRNCKGRNYTFQRHCLLVNMPFTKEDKILIKNLFDFKGYSAGHLVSFREKAKMSAASKSCCNCNGLLHGWSTVVPAVADDAAPTLILLTNWCYTKMASREIIIFCILYLTVWPYCVQNIIKIGRWVLKYSKPKQSFLSMTKKAHFGGSWFPR